MAIEKTRVLRSFKKLCMGVNWKLEALMIDKVEASLLQRLNVTVSATTFADHLYQCP